jgi:hypothetical protein
MLTLIAGVSAYSAYIAFVVAILARSRKPADTESLLVLTGKVLLVHAILAVIGTLLGFFPQWTLSTLAGIALAKWVFPSWVKKFAQGREPRPVRD